MRQWMHSWPGLLLWLLAGGLIGLALLAVDVWFVALPLALLGAGLGGLALRFAGRRYLPGLLIGFGLLPGLWLLGEIISAGRPCSNMMVLVQGSPTPRAVSCSELPGSYDLLCAVLLLLALVGGGWLLLRLWRARRPGPADIAARSGP